MAGISSPGIGSGLDINDIVTKLMTAERAPLTRLDAREAPLQAQLSAFGTVKSALAALRDATTTLATPGKFDALSAKTGDTTIASATASATAAAGTHAIEVLTLARAHTLATAAQPSASTTLGSGTITLQFGTYDAGTFTQNPERATRTITIAAGQSTLASVRDAINAAGAGVSASIVNDGTGYRLALSSTASGTANAMRITVSDSDGNHTDATGLSALAFDAAAGGTMNLEEKVAAQDATLVVDGITVSRSSNVASDILEGVTLTLAKAGSTTLTIARDTTSAVNVVQGFVKAYNDLRGIIKAASGYDADRQQGGILLGDAALRGIQSGLRATFNQAVIGAGNATTAASIGITFQRDGTLSLDSAKLTAALTDPDSNVGAFFASGATPSDSQVRFVSATSSARAGTYALSVSQIATRGAAVGSVAAATTIVAGANDALTFSVDGEIASVTLGAGTYTAATLAIELQSKMNEKLAASGARVAVTQAAGVLTVTSESYGAQSAVALTAGNALADLFGAPSSTDGVDVAGSIGTFVTTGSGRVLTGGGLNLEVTGGATGDRGTVSYASGFAGRMKDLLDDFLEADGLIADRTEGIDRQIETIDRQREAFERRMETIEARYRAQFTALDTLIARMNSTSNFLTQQLAGLAASLES
jgi:flagellar hook-associated protein 2